MSGQSYTVASTEAIAAKRAALGDFLCRLRVARDWGLANPEEQARVWAKQTGFPVPVGRMVVDTTQTRMVAIDDEVVAAQQQVADFFRAARVISDAQAAATYFDRSFNAAVFAA